MTDIIAYCDGGCRGNPGPGGWGVLIIDPVSREALERCGGENPTTNNRMELMGAIQVLRSFRRTGVSVLIHSDSTYVIKAASEWIPGWKARGWRRKEGPLKNLELLQELDRRVNEHQVSWQWVKGHDGNPGNEHVDRLANQAMDALVQGRSPESERRFAWPRNQALR